MRGVDEERLLELALEAGAEDIQPNDDGSADVISAWEDFGAVKAAMEAAGLVADDGEVTMIAATTVPVDAEGA